MFAYSFRDTPPHIYTYSIYAGKVQALDTIVSHAYEKYDEKSITARANGDAYRR